MQVDSPDHRDRATADRSAYNSRNKKPKRSGGSRHSRSRQGVGAVGSTHHNNTPPQDSHANGYVSDGSSHPNGSSARGPGGRRDRDRDRDRDRRHIGSQTHNHEPPLDAHFQNRHDDAQRAKSPPGSHRYDPRGPMNNVRIISSTSGLESFFADVRHRTETPNNTPLVLVRHRAHFSNVVPSASSVPSDTSDTLSVAYANLSAVIDTTSVARDRLSHLLLLVPLLVVCDPSVPALLAVTGGPEAHAANVYDLSLGHELLDGTFRAPFSSTARAVNVRIAFPDGFPSPPARYSHDSEWRLLARAAMDVRAVFFALSAKLKPDINRWRDLSAQIMSDITARVQTVTSSDLTKHQVKPFRVLAFDSETAEGFTRMIAKYDVGEDVEDSNILGIVDTKTAVRDQQESVRALLAVLPTHWQVRMDPADIHNLVDVQIDLGRAAVAHLRSGCRINLSDTEVVTTPILYAALSAVRRSTKASNYHRPLHMQHEHTSSSMKMNGVEEKASATDTAGNDKDGQLDEEPNPFAESDAEDNIRDVETDNNGYINTTDDHIGGHNNVGHTLRKGFDDDKRGGIPGTLHRVSLLTGRTGAPIGATLRIGRHVHNAAGVLHDILHGSQYSGASILVVGAPGSGKTTMVRDAARMLATRHRVMIVDSSDEIGGPGDVPHPCVGEARRMSVSAGKRGLASALLEAVENHTPDVVVADELRDRAEVAGVITARQRGVRVLASAHGGLRALIRNPVLRPLVGGMDRVTLGDAACAGDVQQKIRHVRAFDAVFDVVVEMGPWTDAPPFAVRIVPQVQTAVDAIMAGRPYWTEMRWRGHDDNILSVDVCV